jgi:predicted small secreted protein
MGKRRSDIFGLLVVILAMYCAGLVACNTIKGAGQDIKAAGGAIEKSAARNRPY